MNQPFTLFDLLEGNLAENGNGVAVVGAGEELTYFELFERVQVTARKLAALGLERGDRVCLHLPKSVLEIVATFAISLLGCAVTNIGVQRTTRQLRHVLQSSGARVLVTTTQKAVAVVADGMPETLEHIVVDTVPGSAERDSLETWSDLPEGGIRLGGPLSDLDVCAIV